MTRRILCYVSLLAWIGLAALIINPVSSTMLRTLFLLCLAGAWLSTLTLIWKWKPLRLGWMILLILLLIPFAFPGRALDEAELRERYIANLQNLEGARYFWGGESPQGIDCSGLPRRSLRDALLSYGLRHFNGRATRLYLAHWWFDASAQALGEGYRDYTLPLAPQGTIAEMDYSGLLPGDLAVTRSGVHILAYLGEGRWIQADPGPLRVIISDGRTDANSWFQQPVTTHRWTLLQP